MRPLEGIRVLDLTRVLSGPYCTMLIGDLGAEVIKVERPGEGDDTRAFAPPFQGDQAAYFLSINRNKKSITLDMKSERGKEILWRLVDLSDVLVENFRPCAMERLGFSYEAVRARRPAMIYCSISGFGDTGPQKDRAGYDVNRTGRGRHYGSDRAARWTTTQGWHLHCRLTAAQGILGALYAAKIDRRGQQVHVSMYEAVAALLTFNASIYFATGTVPRAARQRTATIVPYESFETSDGWINLGVPNDDIWRRFCAAAGAAELADDRPFASAPDRVRNRDALVPIVRAVIKKRSRDEWLKVLDEGDVPCGAIRTVGEVCDSEVLRARGMTAEMPHASAGNLKGVKSAIHLSETVLDTYVTPPRLGEHTREVLIKLLDYIGDEVDMLARGGVIGFDRRED